MNSNSLQDSVAVVGLGYVNLPLAEAFSKSLKVIGFDIDARRVMQLASQQSEFPTIAYQLVTDDSRLIYCLVPIQGRYRNAR